MVIFNKGLINHEKEASLEIISNDESELKQCKSIFNIKTEEADSCDAFTLKLTTNDNKFIYYHNAKNSYSLQYYLEKSMDVPNFIRKTSLETELSILKARLYIPHTSVDLWHERALTFSELYVNNISDLTKQLKREDVHTLLNWVRSSSFATVLHDKYCKYDLFELKDVIREFSLYVKPPLYEMCTNNSSTERFIYHIWKEWKANMRKQAVIELVYSEAFNNYILPKAMNNPENPYSLDITVEMAEYYFKRVLMTRSTKDYVNDFLVEFIINNYKNIWNSLNAKSFINVVTHSFLSELGGMFSEYDD